MAPVLFLRLMMALEAYLKHTERSVTLEKDGICICSRGLLLLNRLLGGSPPESPHSFRRLQEPPGRSDAPERSRAAFTLFALQ